LYLSMSRFINADIELSQKGSYAYVKLSHLNTNYSYHVISAGALERRKARMVIGVDQYKRIRKMATDG